MITYQGRILNEPGWRTNTVSKIAGDTSNDLDGATNDEALGSDGWYLGGKTAGILNIISSLPSYISSVTFNGPAGPTNPYKLGTDPGIDEALTPAASVVDYVPAVFWNNGPGAKDYFTVKLAQDADFLLGVVVDTYGTIQQASTIKVEKVGSPLVMASVAPAAYNKTADWYVFQISGAKDDQFKVVLTGGGDMNSAGLTFEAAVIPEPGTLVGVAALGGVPVLLRRRRAA